MPQRFLFHERPRSTRSLWRPMLREELCCPRANVAPLQWDRGLPAQHIFGRLTALEPRARRGWCDTGQAWRFAGPTRPSTHRLSSVLASTYISAESSDSWSDRSATVAMSNQPKLCCADDSTIGNAAFPTGRGQHASSQMRLRARRGTQHSSSRNISRHMLRATYGDISIRPVVASWHEQRDCFRVGRRTRPRYEQCHERNREFAPGPGPDAASARGRLERVGGFHDADWLVECLDVA